MLRSRFSLIALPAVLFCLQVPEAVRAQEPVAPDERDLVTPPTRPDAATVLLDGQNSWDRGAALVAFVATVRPPVKAELNPKASAPCYAARLVLNTDTAYALEKLDAAVSFQLVRARQRIAQRAAYDSAADRSKLKVPAAPLDPFDKAALINTYFLGRDKIPRATALKIRDFVALFDDHKALSGYAKVAWNYKLMLDISGYLAAEEWPDLVDRTGLNATEIKAATRARLMDYFQEIVRKNMSEYGATIYQGVNLSAVRMLVEFAKDPEVRERATFALDAMMVDIACTWNNGYNVGSASRAKYWGSTDTSPDSMFSTAAAAWVYFGGRRPVSSAGLGFIHSFWMATPGVYQVPALIVSVARDRTTPFVHRSAVAGMGPADVRRTTYHSLNYALCSQWDHAGSPTAGLYKESRRNMLKWVSDKPSSTLAVCMDNPARPYALQENRPNAVGYGENAFAQYLQDDGTLLGLYSVPETVKAGRNTFPYPYYRLYVPFPNTGSILKRWEKGGWVFCHTGSMLFGFRSIKPYAWDKKPWLGNSMLRVEARKNGWVLETSELAPYAGGGVDAELERFASAVLSKTSLDTSALEGDVPQLKYTALSGRVLEMTYVPHNVPYKDQSKVDGRVVDYASWPLFGNRWVHQDLNSPVLKIEYGGKSLVYDFSRWTRVVSTAGREENATAR